MDGNDFHVTDCSHEILQTLVNEMYPTDVRTHCIAINSSVGLLISSLNLALYPGLKSTIGVCGNLMIYNFTYMAISIFMAFWGLILFLTSGARVWWNLTKNLTE